MGAPPFEISFKFSPEFKSLGSTSPRVEGRPRRRTARGKRINVQIVQSGTSVLYFAR